MGRSILITQCMQRDFVAPIAAHEPHPNALHVGRDEATRLLGPDPSRGPFAQLVHWARSAASDTLHVIHIRDWHDADDPRQRAHLDRFGEHCIRNTPGAALVLDVDAEVTTRPNEHFVNSLTLNDFQDTTLGSLMDQLTAETPVRVGVVGVWTEAKVSFLLYELATRCGIENLATCSALTASASRAQHFNALDQLRKILGVNVFDSVGEFTSWLDPDSGPIALPKLSGGVAPQLIWDDEPCTLDAQDQALLGFLYRDSAKLYLNPLGGGFSGALVFRVRAEDALGHEQAPSVAKLGPRSLIAKERVAFEQVESILGNFAPSVRGFVDLGDRAGLKYAYAGMGTGDVRTFKSIYESGAPFSEVERILRTVFEDVMSAFTRAAIYERLPLLEYYGFAAHYADSVRARVAKVMACEPDTAVLDFGDGYRVGNVADFYERDLPALPRSFGESHFVAYVHGDLNGANILVDARDNVWLIDFFHTHRGHIIKDAAKLENDLLYIFTPVETDEDFAEALTITRTLRAVRDLAADLPALPGLQRPQMRRAWDTLRLLRRFVAALCQSDRDPNQLRVALLRYGVHTMSFDESSPLQKRWALASSCAWAEDIATHANASTALRVDWVGLDDLYGAAQLGLTICPGRRDRGRDLAADLDTLVREGVGTLVSLLPSHELEWAGGADLVDAAESRDLKVLRLAIPDQGICSMEELSKTVALISEALSRGEKVVIHCMGGLGRSGLMAAAVLIRAGLSAEPAVERVRAARGPRAVETQVQYDFVKRYSASISP